VDCISRLRLNPGFFKLFVIAGGINYPVAVTHKSARIAAMIESLQGREQDARYLGYFDCFNRQLFYEAHDVLEDLWLADRRGPNGNFYKGLIQLAGAFVHLQKNRLRPSAALFKLAQANLEQYPARHEQLNLAAVQLLVHGWLAQLEKGVFQTNPLTPQNRPQLALQK
jgi:predicted metal-dependent hydrolase